jgi:hypothetical protein
MNGEKRGKLAVVDEKDVCHSQVQEVCDSVPEEKDALVNNSVKKSLMRDGAVQ